MEGYKEGAAGGGGRCCRNAPDAVVLEESLYERAQRAQLAHQLFRFDWHFVPVRPENASDDNVHRLQKHISDAEGAKVGGVQLQDM